ncbi:MAG: hypothetical protein ACTSO2_05570 [Promethearchaeota archaeon]
MELFEITDEQEAISVSDYKYIKEALSANPDKVYLIVDDDYKQIWIYKREDAPILLQFKAKYVQELMRKQLKGFYRKMDMNTLLKNSEEYNRILESKISNSRAQEIHKKETEQELTETQKKIKETIEESRAKEICVHKEVSPRVARSEALKLVDLDNYKRHMCIIGGDVYFEKTNINKFFTSNEQEKILKKLGPLPNGFFFLEGVSSRLLIKRGSVYCLDIMIEKDHSFGIEKLEVPIYYREDLRKQHDISELFKYFKEAEVSEKNNNGSEE